jgi:hypothetical protein
MMTLPVRQSVEDVLRRRRLQGRRSEPWPRFQRHLLRVSLLHHINVGQRLLTPCSRHIHTSGYTSSVHSPAVDLPRCRPWHATSLCPSSPNAGRSTGPVPALGGRCHRLEPVQCSSNVFASLSSVLNVANGPPSLNCPAFRSGRKSSSPWLSGYIAPRALPRAFEFFIEASFHSANRSFFTTTLLFSHSFQNRSWRTLNYNLQEPGAY